MFDGPRKYAISHESIVDENIDYPSLYRLSDGRLAVMSDRSYHADARATKQARLYVSDDSGRSWRHVPLKPDPPGSLAGTARPIEQVAWDIPLPLTHEFGDGEGICVLGNVRTTDDPAYSTIMLNRFKNGSVDCEEGQIHIPDRMDNRDGIQDIFWVNWDQVRELDDGSLLTPAAVRLRGDNALIDLENFELAAETARGNARSSYSRTIILRSEDRGRKWRMWGNVGTRHEDEGFNEGTLRLTPTGELVIVMRMGHQSPLHISWSTDQGRTWSEPQATAFATGTLPKLTVLEDGSLVLLHGIQSILPPEITGQVHDERPSLNLGFQYRMGQVNLAVSRNGTGRKWDEVGNVLTWPNTTGNGGIISAGPNRIGLAFDMRGYRTRMGKFTACVVKYVEVDLGELLWPR